MFISKHSKRKYHGKNNTKFNKNQSKRSEKLKTANKIMFSEKRTCVQHFKRCNGCGKMVQQEVNNDKSSSSNLISDSSGTAVTTNSDSDLLNHSLEKIRATTKSRNAVTKNSVKRKRRMVNKVKHIETKQKNEGLNYNHSKADGKRLTKRKKLEVVDDMPSRKRKNEDDHYEQSKYEKHGRKKNRKDTSHNDTGGNRTPPPPWLDPTANDPGANDVETKESNHSNSPRFPGKPNID